MKLKIVTASILSTLAISEAALGASGDSCREALHTPESRALAKSMAELQARISEMPNGPEKIHLLSDFKAKLEELTSSLGLEFKAQVATSYAARTKDLKTSDSKPKASDLSAFHAQLKMRAIPKIKLKDTEVVEAATDQYLVVEEETPLGKMIRLYDHKTGDEVSQRLLSFEEFDPFPGDSLGYSIDQTQLSWKSQRSLHTLDLVSGEEKRWNFPKELRDFLVVPSHDQKSFFVRTDDRKLVKIDRLKMKEVARSRGTRLPYTVNPNFHFVSVSADGRYVLAGGDHVEILDATTLERTGRAFSLGGRPQQSYPVWIGNDAWFYFPSGAATELFNPHTRASRRIPKGWGSHLEILRNGFFLTEKREAEIITPLIFDPIELKGQAFAGDPSFPLQSYSRLNEGDHIVYLAGRYALWLNTLTMTGRYSVLPAALQKTELSLVSLSSDGKRLFVSNEGGELFELSLP